MKPFVFTTANTYVVRHYVGYDGFLGDADTLKGAWDQVIDQLINSIHEHVSIIRETIGEEGYLQGQKSLNALLSKEN